MPRLSSGILGFPSFSGFTRRLVLLNLAAYFLLLILGVADRLLAAEIAGILALDPALVLRHGWIWQLGTYWIIHAGILNTAFELLSLWFLGSFLEQNHGARWMSELFFVSVLGAGLATLALYLVLPQSSGSLIGIWGGIFGLLIAFGVLYADMEFMMFPLPMMIKAKYLVAVYMLIALAMLFSAEKGLRAFAARRRALRIPLHQILPAPRIRLRRQRVPSTASAIATTAGSAAAPRRNSKCTCASTATTEIKNCHPERRVRSRQRCRGFTGAQPKDLERCPLVPATGYRLHATAPVLHPDQRQP